MLRISQYPPPLFVNIIISLSLYHHPCVQIVSHWQTGNWCWCKLGGAQKYALVQFSFVCFSGVCVLWGGITGYKQTKAVKVCKDRHREVNLDFISWCHPLVYTPKKKRRHYSRNCLCTGVTENCNICNSFLTIRPVTTNYITRSVAIALCVYWGDLLSRRKYEITHITFFFNFTSFSRRRR